jgi:large repetitive protein
MARPEDHTHVRQLFRRNWVRVVTRISLGLVALAGIVGISVPAGAVGVPVIIDNFSGTVLGTRTITPLPLPQTSTTPAGTFAQANAEGTMTMSGQGNGDAGTELDYSVPSGVDLTGAGNNSQLLVDFALVHQIPASGQPTLGVSMSISVTSTNGNSCTSGLDGVGNYFAFNAAFSFSQDFGGGVGSCVGGKAVDWTHIADVNFTFYYPVTQVGGSLTVIVNKLWATPSGGAPPDAPSPSVTAPASAAGLSTTPVDFDVDFAADGLQAPVTYNPPSDTGVRAQDLTVSGTAFGAATPKVVVSGGPSNYTVAVSNMQQAGTVVVDVPAGVVDDAWGQLNTASTNDPSVAFTYALPPVFTSAASATFTAGTNGSAGIAVTGPPAPVTTETGALPNGVSFTDNGDPANTGNDSATIAGKPAVGSGGVYSLGLSATNPAATTPQTFTLTVNEAPVFSSAATSTFSVANSSTFDITTVDSFPTNPTVSETGTLPQGVTFTAGSNGTATLSGMPAVGSGGSYPITLQANNGVNPATSQTFTLKVDEAPSVTSASSTTFTAGTTGTFQVTTSHSYPAPPIISDTGALPQGVSFIDNGDGTATLSGKPAAGTGGIYPISISVSDGIESAVTQTFTLTVNAAPVITSADSTIFTTGQNGTFTVTTSGAYPAATTLNDSGILPQGVHFLDNADGTATISGEPSAGSGGIYSFTVNAANGVGPATSQTFTLTVDEAPTITSANAATFAVGSAGTFQLTTGHSFPVDPTLTEQGALPHGVTLTDNLDGTATLAGTPAAGTGGIYNVILTASNGVSPDGSQPFTLTVNEAPAFTSADQATFTVGSQEDFTVTAPSYPSAETLSQTGSLPTGVKFTDNGDGTATLSGTPATGTGGTYTVSFGASNGISPDARQTFTLMVDEAPTITSGASTTFSVGTSGAFTVTTSHAWPTPPTLTAIGTLPTGVTFIDHGDGTASFMGSPAAGTGGVFNLTVSASNGVNPDATQSFTLTVDEAPTFTSASSSTTAPGSAFSFTITTGHAYPAVETLTETGSLPTGVNFTDNGDGTATLAGMAAAGSGAIYGVTLGATNGISPDATQTFTLTVDEAPAITSRSSSTFTTGTLGSFGVTTSHAFPNNPTMTEIGSLPTGVHFTDNADGTATLGGTPAAGSGGIYVVTLGATNGISPDATQTFTLTVDEAPTITSTDTAQFTVGTSGSTLVTTTAYPGGSTITESGPLPQGVTFTNNGDGTATLGGEPAAGTGGQYAITLTATNGVSPDGTQTFTLIVNQPAAFTSTPPAAMTVGVSGGSTLSASGYPYPTFTETGVLPTGVTLAASGNGTAVLGGKPAVGSDGSYPVTVTATNGVGVASSQSIVLVVHPRPAPPGPGAALTPLSTVATNGTGATRTATFGPTDVAVHYAANDFVADTSFTLYPGDPATGGQLLPTGAASYVTGVGVSWLTPGGTQPAVGTAVTVTLTDPSIAAGDAVWGLTTSGPIYLGLASSSGTVTVHITGVATVVVGGPSGPGIPGGGGYWMVGANGSLFAFGTAPYEGAPAAGSVHGRVEAMVGSADGKGYLLASSNGGVFAYGDANFEGSLGAQPLNQPIVGIASTPDTRGYWLVASDGGVFAFGDAGYYGSLGGTSLNRPIVGMASTPDGKGYWLVASDGGVFAFGDAGYYGSLGGQSLNQPIVAIAHTPDGRGYWLVAADGGVFAYGDAGFFGSGGSLHLNQPVVGVIATPDGLGYWLVASDGGVFAYGDAGFFGSLGSTQLTAPIVGAV